MMVATLVLMGAMAQGSKATFAHPDTGLIFDYPAEWSRKKNRNNWEFEFSPAEGQRAKFEVFGLVYSSTIEVYQQNQAQAYTQMKRTVARQWQEELLAVPLVLTRTEWTEGKDDKAKPMVSISGLMYSQTPRKLVWRLTAPATSWDAAELAVRTTLQTLRTDDGSSLRPFDPNSKPTPAEAGALRPAARSVWRQDPGEAPKIERAKSQWETTAAGRKTFLFYPEGWTLTPVEGGAKLKHPELATEVGIEALSNLDSMPVGRQYLRYGGQSLALFKDVKSREEPMPFNNKAGLVCSYVYRAGIDKSDAPLFSIDAAGANAANEYWTLRWRSADPKTADKDKKRVLDLIQRMSIELAPAQ